MKTRNRSRIHRDAKALGEALLDNLTYALGQGRQSASILDLHLALSLTIRDQLVSRWRQTTEAQFQSNPKFVYYLSMEFLLGKQLPQNLLYTGLQQAASEALSEHGVPLESLIRIEAEPGLGNGGLGRLAACYLDSLATLDIPCVGYGLRYEYGIFQQAIVNGWQVEQPDEWTRFGNPWEFPQPDDMVEVGFYGHTQSGTGEDGSYHVDWIPEETVLGEPYHVLVPGYGTQTVNMLRLWRAVASESFDFQLFDTGDYARAVEQKVLSESITKVLYPNDNAPKGKELRLKQQYFFVACTLRDIIRRYQIRNPDWNAFPDKVAIQLNDTHPVLAVIELMRILMDESGLSWEKAWEITRNTFAYTCHTLLPEALETWPVDLFGRLLPRHLELVYEINRRHLDDVRKLFPGDGERAARMSLIEEGPVRRVRMANLATVASHSVNGVAELHTRLLKETTLRDFAEAWPGKFNNKTNGVTPRRFMALANPRLAGLITSRIGEGWLRDLDRLRDLERHAEDPEFLSAWRDVKHANKEELVEIVARTNRIAISADSLFDVLVKRLHEYKRQLLKALHVAVLYRRIQADPGRDVVPRTFLFGAKAAPGYGMAKRIIKLINSIGDVVNGDPAVAGRLRVVFLPNFNVTLAERVYPAADLSEQISLAGKEASGTGNMKFALNGALTVGTLDGANVEIREKVGEENFFLFGMTADEVQAFRHRGYDPRSFYEKNEELRGAIDAIARGEFSGGDRDVFRDIVDSLLGRDEYFLLADFASYEAAQERAASAYLDRDGWTRKSVLNTARCGFFSSDRAVREYCEEIWKVKPVPVDGAG